MKITFYNLQKEIRYLKNYALREFFIRLIGNYETGSQF